MALNAKHKQYVTALGALKQIGLRIGMYGRFRKFPVLTEQEKYESLLCVAVITDSNQNLVAKMACVLILDYYVPAWREIIGIEALGNVVDRNDKEVGEWRKKVLKRDDNKCRECELTENLEVHHIAHWADYPELRLNEDNGMTLCNGCHAKEHDDSKFILARVG